MSDCVFTIYIKSSVSGKQAADFIAEKIKAFRVLAEQNPKVFISGSFIYRKDGDIAFFDLYSRQQEVTEIKRGKFFVEHEGERIALEAAANVKVVLSAHETSFPVGEGE